MVVEKMIHGHRTTVNTRAEGNGPGADLNVKEMHLFDQKALGLMLPIIRIIINDYSNLSFDISMHIR